MATPLPYARTYNQAHITRPHNGSRRVSIYWSWSYPWEAQRDPALLYNRFSTMTEVRATAVRAPLDGQLQGYLDHLTIERGVADMPGLRRLGGFLLVVARKRA